MFGYLRTFFVGLGFVTLTRSADAQPATLELARPAQCEEALESCAEFDAIVFVHGIYGGESTFRGSNGFDWPKEFPEIVEKRRVDVYRLLYPNALLSWAKNANPNFDSVAVAILNTMKPLRERRYRSIGFVTHSLGGNVISTYVHTIKTKFGHPARSQHAFTITLAVPVLGSHVADIGSALKSLLGISDPLLASLRRDNLFLTMLNEWRFNEQVRQRMYGCRPVHLHAAYEERHLGPLLIVGPQSAAVSISRLVNSPIIGFNLDHAAIAKPTGTNHDVYRWVLGHVEGEYMRLEDWHKSRPARQLCDSISWQREP